MHQDIHDHLQESDQHQNQQHDHDHDQDFDQDQDQDQDQESTFLIYPAILTESIQLAQSQVMAISAVPKIRTVQIDVIDGQYADNVTITPSDLPEIDFSELSCDLHLMTEEPLDFLHEAIAVRELVPVRAVIGQIERMSHQRDFLLSVKEQSWVPGLSLDLFTPVDEIDDQAWDSLDIVQLMGVEAGFQGQSFNPLVLKKIKELQKVAKEHNRSIEICIDGGVSLEVVEELRRAGATSVVVGSGIWEQQDVIYAVAEYLE